MNNLNKNSDLPDSEIDRKELNPENAELNLPDVSDISGQENITPPDLKEMKDTTMASGDEEGVGVFEEDELVAGEQEGFMLTDTQKEALDQTGSQDDKNLRIAAVDETDEDGIPLNEKDEEKDLDVPGAENDDADENIGEEDEENNFYSFDDNQ